MASVPQLCEWPPLVWSSRTLSTLSSLFRGKMIPEELERQINVAEAEVGEGTGQ